MVLEKAVAAARTRIAARHHKDAQRRKTALESSSLPAKLADCRSNDVERSELFIVEGDSAPGTAKFARNSEFQALLPIRGKILNVQKSSVTDMLKYAECGAIIQMTGAGSGRAFDLDAARYGKIIMMTDADVDGSHIRTLLLTLFHRYMRPMAEAGRVFAAVPPLHRVELLQPKKGRSSTSTRNRTASCATSCSSSRARTSGTRTRSSGTSPSGSTSGSRPASDPVRRPPLANGQAAPASSRSPSSSRPGPMPARTTPGPPPGRSRLPAGADLPVAGVRRSES